MLDVCLGITLVLDVGAYLHLVCVLLCTAWYGMRASACPHQRARVALSVMRVHPSNTCARPGLLYGDLGVLGSGLGGVRNEVRWVTVHNEKTKSTVTATPMLIGPFQEVARIITAWFH